ncbi:uncharacterized protein LOC143857851 isoform X2 [Tasmannia lanceolata]|uniref:uncharacterized protein LOC143857851 isoform X2 n=1 Tax=Tasmannia lanceolata TaxID=3420 RepID=UPI0040641578
MVDVVSMGILLDIVDEEWMRDTLPYDDVPLPPEVATRTEDVEDNSRDHSSSRGTLPTRSFGQPPIQKAHGGFDRSSWESKILCGRSTR